MLAGKWITASHTQEKELSVIKQLIDPSDTRNFVLIFTDGSAAQQVVDGLHLKRELITYRTLSHKKYEAIEKLYKMESVLSAFVRKKIILEMRRYIQELDDLIHGELVKL